jgi:hypothetical protein
MERMQRRSAERRELASDDAAVKHRENLLDEALDATFPASDPFSLNLAATPFTSTNKVHDESRNSTAAALQQRQKENTDGA